MPSFFFCESKGEATGSFERVVLAGIPSFPRPEDAEDLGAYLVMREIQFIDLNNFFLSSFWVNFGSGSKFILLLYQDWERMFQPTSTGMYQCINGRLKWQRSGDPIQKCRCLRGIRDFVVLEGQGSIENLSYPKSACSNTFLEVASIWRQGRVQVFGALEHLVKRHFKPWGQWHFQPWGLQFAICFCQLYWIHVYFPFSPYLWMMKVQKCSHMSFAYWSWGPASTPSPRSCGAFQESLPGSVLQPGCVQANQTLLWVLTHAGSPPLHLGLSSHWIQHLFSSVLA